MSHAALHKKPSISDADRRHAQSLIGQEISGRYRIDKLLAMGGMGAVYLGEHVLMRKRVAIKILHRSAEQRPVLVRRFEREAIAGSHVQHPNVAATTDFGELPGGSYYLVLEHVEGITLNEIIRRGPLPVSRAIHIARQIAEALAATHAAGIVHRDLKPLNVMVVHDQNDLVKLIDFGFAKVPMERFSQTAGPRLTELLERPLDAEQITGSGMVFGTISYLAPEAAFGMHAVDVPADLYALGLITYEMLAGKHPFIAQDPAELFRQQCKTTPPPIAAYAPGVRVPPELEAVVMRLIEKQPLARYRSAAAVIAALDDVCKAQKINLPNTISAYPRPLPKRSQPNLSETELDMQRLAVQNVRISSPPPARTEPVPSPPPARTEPVPSPPPARTEPVPSPPPMPTSTREAGWNVAVLSNRPPTTPQSNDEIAKRPFRSRRRSQWLAAAVIATAAAGLGAVKLAPERGWRDGSPDVHVSAGLLAPAPGAQPATPHPAAGGDTSAPTNPPSAAPAAAAPPVDAAGSEAADTAKSGSAPEPQPTVARPAGSLQRALVDAVAAQRWATALSQLIDIAERSPSALQEPATAQAARATAIAAVNLNLKRTGRMFEVLAYRAGTAGIDILYDMVAVTGRAAAGQRAAYLLRQPGVAARATPATRIAFELRDVPCSRKLRLLDRAVKEGDRRALAAMETSVASCFRASPMLDAAARKLRARLDARR